MSNVGIVPGSSLTDFVSRSWEVLFVVDRETAAVGIGSVGAASVLGSKPSALCGLCCLCLFDDLRISDWDAYVAHLDHYPAGFVTFKTTLKRPHAHSSSPLDDPAAHAISVTLQTFEAHSIIFTVHRLEWRPSEVPSQFHAASGAQLGFCPASGETKGLCASPRVVSEDQGFEGLACQHSRDFELEETHFTYPNNKCKLADSAVETETFSSVVTESEGSSYGNGSPGVG